MNTTIKCALLIGLMIGNVWAAPMGPAIDRPALHSKLAAQSVLQSVAKAGDALVAVGERGIIVRSEDQGRSWKQAHVPVSVGLTAVQFVDNVHGWAVGHGGVVLSSEDGGKHWLKRLDGVQAAQFVQKEAVASGSQLAQRNAERLITEGADKPLLALHFFDERRGIVVGAYNMALMTEDGGEHWRSIALELDNPQGLHLNTVSARGDQLLIAGEQGIIVFSTDHGKTFRKLTSPYKGSFFTSELSGEGDIAVAGLRGNVWRSGDGGSSWSQLSSPDPISFTGSTLDARGQLWLVNQTGSVFIVRGQELVPKIAGQSPLNGIVLIDGEHALGVGVTGVVPLSFGDSPIASGGETQ
jgi:photosystem II stability/assembly factor-like uncharacterized protein